ncbi:prepilin peptidase [Bradyrhizobium oropedii]|uniref:prepilin peptidase n=1 Tax=Bradyrhizobium oropedii TaxID=1571201 RepID=UPI001E434B2B|nr:A24 family peptidase [Bradyrhizobium oropedii]
MVLDDHNRANPSRDDGSIENRLFNARELLQHSVGTRHTCPATMPIDREALYFIGSYGALCVLCCAVALIDLRHGVIPSWLNLAIAALGLANVVITDGTTAAFTAMAIATLVGMLFWLLQRLYFAVRGVDGLGLGDVKFLAAAAIWVGALGVPTLLLIAALAALAVAGGLQLAGREMKRQTSIPFGPFLALGLLLTPALQSLLGFS